MRTSYVAAGVLVIALCLWMASGLFGSEGNDGAEASTAINSAEQSDKKPSMKVEYIDVQLSLTQVSRHHITRSSKAATSPTNSC